MCSPKVISPPPSLGHPPHLSFRFLLRFAGRNRRTPLKSLHSPLFFLRPSPRFLSMSSSSKLSALLGSRPSQAPAPLRPNLPIKSGSETSALSSLTYVSDLEKPGVNLEQPSLSDASPRVSTLARRIHGWSWQAVRLTRPLTSRESVISVLLHLIVPHRHGHGYCLCHSVGLERSSGTFHEHRDRFFLHKHLALSPQFIDSPASSILCDFIFSEVFRRLNIRIL